MKVPFSSSLATLIFKEDIQIQSLLREERMEIKRMNGLFRHQLEKTDAVAFQHSHPNDRIAFAFENGLYPEP